MYYVRTNAPDRRQAVDLVTESLPQMNRYASARSWRTVDDYVTCWLVTEGGAIVAPRIWQPLSRGRHRVEPNRDDPRVPALARSWLTWQRLAIYAHVIARSLNAAESWAPHVDERSRTPERFANWVAEA